MSLGHGLGYDAAPPFSAPLRFFLTAPLFGVAAGSMLVLMPDLMDSRWTPGALATTHLITVGFMLMVMVGALFQILPVVCGGGLPAVRRSAIVVHTLLSAGTLTLAGGLLTMTPTWLILASWLLGTGMAAFVAAAALALLRAPSGSGSQRDIRIALIGLAVAVMLGLTVTFILARGLGLPLMTTLKLHVGWALFGGAGILLAATSWIVVPMFQITPPYPVLLTRWWAITSALALLLWSVPVVLDWPLAASVMTWGLGLLATSFLVVTLGQLRKTRRGRPDASFRAYRFGILCLLGGLVPLLAQDFIDHPVLPVLCGVLVLYGGFVSIIQGMLYKIVPFLAWLHLTQVGLKAPNVKQLQPEKPAKAQLTAHAVAVTMLVLGVVTAHPGLLQFAGALVALECSWLLLNLLGIVGAYRQALRASPPQQRARDALTHT
ncbi:hypothetical protein ACKVEX_09720 [Rhodocyclaceae bacterium SMB388]